MTPQQKLKHMILSWAQEYDYQFTDGGRQMPEITADNIDEVFDSMEEEEPLWDARSETREGDYETGLPCPASRHYESKSVARQYRDGSWVGWTYWYGGGKHGQPEEMEWIEDAYDVECVEEIQTMMVRTFSKPAEEKAA